MRVALGCSIGGAGHLTPVLAVAGALRRLGHAPVVLVPPALATVARAGATGETEICVGGEPPHAVIDAVWDRVRRGPPEAVVGLVDRELFAAHATDAMLPAARALLAAARPQLVVREPCEYATAMAAHAAGIPQAQVAISQSAIDSRVLAAVSPTLEVRCPGVAAAIAAAPFLTAFPSSLDPSPWPDTRRYRDPGRSPAPLPDWWPAQRDTPLVYLTFGSVLGGLPEACAVYRGALAALGGLPVRVLLTVGRRFDAAQLGHVPGNVHAEPWVPQADVLAEATLVVCHGGSGTAFGALAAGVPVLACPLFADQMANALLLRRAGAGAVFVSARAATGGVGGLDPGDAPALRAAVSAALHDPGLRAGARRLAAELAGHPPLDGVLATLCDAIPAA